MQASDDAVLVRAAGSGFEQALAADVRRSSSAGFAALAVGVQPSSSAGLAASGPVQALAADAQFSSSAGTAVSGPGQALADDVRTSSSADFAAAVQPSSSVGAAASDRANEFHGKNITNPWNRFQHANKGKGISNAMMAKLYKQQKAGKS